MFKLAGRAPTVPYLTRVTQAPTVTVYRRLTLLHISLQLLTGFQFPESLSKTHKEEPSHSSARCKAPRMQLPAAFEPSLNSKPRSLVDLKLAMTASPNGLTRLPMFSLRFRMPLEKLSWYAPRHELTISVPINAFDRHSRLRTRSFLASVFFFRFVFFLTPFREPF